VEWVEEIVVLCQQIVERYAQKVGEHYILLSKPQART
jgi:hypothetical protein